MKTSRTKKSPTPTPAKVTGTELLMKTPKESGASLPPADLDARVAALEKALMTVLVHLTAAFCFDEIGVDARTKRVLEELEHRVAAGAALARLKLPESVYDDASEEWDALPHDAKKLFQHANAKLLERFVSLGLMPAEKESA